MIFHWPHLLWLLAPVAALAVWDALRRRERARDRPKILRVWAGVRRAAVGDSRRATRGRLLLWLGLALGVVSLARPQWGRIETPVFDQSREIILSLDLSRSMLAPDVRPSRLERARLLIQGLLDGLRGERVGLIVFAGTAFLQVPLSADYEVLNEFLPELSPRFLPQGGTDYQAMLRAAIEAFGAGGGAADRFLIALSDGESQTEDWKNLVDDLKKRNIRVLALGVGTPEGALLPDGSGGYVKDERGAVVLSKLDSSTLQELARATGGVYADASAWVDLGRLLKQTVEAGRSGEFQERREVLHIERFQWALAPALLCLLLSFWREFPVQPRPRALPLATEAGGRRREAGKPVTTALIALALLSAISFPVSGFGAEDVTAYAAPLSKLVERLSAQPALSARHYAELANETVAWGKRLQGAHSPVTPGPVRDALAGVDLGGQLDPKAADWPQLRRDLEELLKKPPEPPPQDQPQQQDQQGQQQQSQRNSGEGSSDQQDQPQEQQDRKPTQPEQQKDQAQNPEPETQNQPETPKPNTGETQKIGGQPKESDEKTDPSLALPIQKLDQLRNQDSPARLFQMLDSQEHKPRPKPGRDW